MGEWVYDPVSGGQFYVPDPGENAPPGATGGGGTPSPEPAPQPTPPPPEPPPDNGWKPDFGNPDPWAGMPPDYPGIGSFNPDPDNGVTTPPWEGSQGAADAGVPKYGTPEYQQKAQEIAVKYLEPYKLPDGNYNITEIAKAGKSSYMAAAGFSPEVVSRTRQLAEQIWATERTERGTQQALGDLKDFGNETDGYNLGKALAGGVPVQTLINAGFSQTQIEAAMAQARYFQASPEGKFAILQAEGTIPKDARFEGIDPDGTIRYSFVPKNEVDKVAVARNMIETRNRVGASSDNVTPSKGLGSIEDFARNNPKEYAEANKQLRIEATVNRNEAIMSLIPVYGSARSISHWDKQLVYNYDKGTGNFVPSDQKTAIGWKVFDVVNLGMDVIFVASLAKSGVKSAFKTGAEAVADASKPVRAVKLFEAPAAEALGEVAKTDPALAKAFTNTSKAATKYAELTESIARTEKYLKTLPSGAETRPEVERGLELMRSRLPKAQQQLEGAARDFAQTGKAKIRAGLTKQEIGPPVGARDVAALQDLDELPKNIPRQIQQLVDRQVNPRTVKVIQSELADAEAALSKSRSMGTTEMSKLYDLTGDVRKLRTELAVAQAGDIQKLESQWRVLRNETIPQLEQGLKNAKAANSPAVQDFERALQQAKLSEMKTRQTLGDAYKYLEEQWPAEPIPRGGGGVATRPRGPEIYRGGGGGRVETPYKITYQNARIVGVDSYGNVTYVIKPLVTRINVPGKETIHVEPQPYWAGEVKTAPDPTRTTPFMPDREPYTVPQPETEPAPRPPFAPGPGRITWTPGVQTTPDIKAWPITETTPGEEPGTQPGTQPGEKTGTDTGTRTGTQPDEGTKTRPSEGVKTGTVTQPFERTQERTQEQTRLQEQTKPQEQFERANKSTSRVGTLTPRLPGATGKKRRTSKDDQETRRLISEADTKAAWVQGELHGKPVIHVVWGKNGQYDSAVLVGPVPEGVVMAKGKGQAYRSIRLTQGIPPSRPVQLEGGAVDPVVEPTKDDRGVTIRFVHDDSVKHASKEKPQFRINRRGGRSSRGFDLGADIVRDRRGRHLRL